MLAFKNSDPNTHFIKATDKENGDIVGVAKWNIYIRISLEEVGLQVDDWETEEDNGVRKLTQSYVPRAKDEGNQRH